MSWKGTGCGDIAFGETKIGAEGDLVARPVDIGIVSFQPGHAKDYWISSKLGVSEGKDLFVRSDGES